MKNKKIKRKIKELKKLEIKVKKLSKKLNLSLKDYLVLKGLDIKI